jgi:hypothetical protein
MSESKPLETKDLEPHPANPPAKGAEVNQPAKGSVTRSPQPREQLPARGPEAPEQAPRAQPRAQAAQDKLAQAKAQRAEQTQALRARGKWRPTPTQEECDLVAMGCSVDEVGHAPDGSPPDPYSTRNMWPRQGSVPEETREMQPAQREGGYQTR